MDTLTSWLFLSFTVERLVELLLTLVPKMDKKQLFGVDVPVLLALLLSLVLSYGARLDFFAIFEIRFAWPLIGMLFSALFMVGGSGVIHDLLSLISVLKNNSR